MEATHPLNVFKFCPRCGSPEFPVVGERSFKCCNCGFHFYINASAAVAALIFNGKGEMMFTRRAIEPGFGKLDLPGGFADPLETAEQALRRELMEELALEADSLEYFASAPNEYVYSGFTVFTLDFAFLVKPKSLSGLKPMDDISGFEFIHPLEVNFDDLPARSMQLFVKEYLKRNGTDYK